MSELKWAQPLLGEVATVIDPHPSHRAPPEVDGGVPFVGIGDLTERGEVLASTARKVSPSVLEEHKTRYSVARGDIAYGRVATVGKVMRFGEFNEPFALSPTMALIQPHGVAASYLAHFLQSKQWDDESAKLLTGTTRSSLGIQLLRKIRISCPRSFEEQEAIGGVLDTLDTAIHETEAIIAKLNAVKQGLLHDLLTRGIDANGELRPPPAEAPHLYMESPLGWIPKEWEVVPISEIATNLDGQRVPIKEGFRKAGDYPYYGASGVIDWVDSFLFDGDYVLLGEDGENVVSRRLPLAFRATGKIWVNNHAHVFEPKVGVDIRFLAEVMEAKDYGPWVSGSAQPKITQEALSRIRFVKPSSEEQASIGQRLEALGNRIAQEGLELSKLQSSKLGLMDDLLTGRVRVTPLLAEAAPQAGSS